MSRIVINLFLTGLLFGSGPCMISCGPLVTAYLLGTGKKVVNSLRLYILFSLGRIFVYLLLSCLAFILGNLLTEKLLKQSAQLVILLGGCFIAFLGMAVILNKTIKSCHWQFAQKIIIKSSESNSILLGFIVGLLPCLPFLGILSYLGLVSKTLPQSLLYSLSFGLGISLSPLILLVLFSGLVNKFLEKQNQVYSRISGFVSGIIMVFLGIQLILHG